jgi:hypothetical protein
VLIVAPPFLGKKRVQNGHIERDVALAVEVDIVDVDVVDIIEQLLDVSKGAFRLGRGGGQVEFRAHGM